MTDYKRVDDVRAFLSRKGNVRTGVHNFSQRKILHWPYCANCGLALLKNDVSRRAARAPCRWEDD